MVTAVLLNLHDVNLVFLAAKMVFAELVVDAFGNIINAPIHSVEEKVGIEGICAGSADAPLHTSRPQVASVLCFLAVALAPVLPGIAEVAAEYELVELGGLILTIEWIL